MKKSLLLIVGSLFCLGVADATVLDGSEVSAYDGYPEEVEDICRNLDTTADMLACSSAQLEWDDKVLNENYKKALAAKRTDKERQELRDFQRQWIKDRDKYCKEELAGGGTASSLNYVGCLIEWTKTRSIQLENMAD